MAWLNQTSFGSGELSESVACRVDLQKYSTGARRLYNMFVHPAGGASNRPGTEFVNTAKYTDKRSRLVPFQFSEVQAYVLEFGEKYIRVYKDGGIVMDGNSPVEIFTPYMATDLPLLKYTQSADVLYLCHPNHKTRTLSRYSHTSWTLQEFQFKNGPFLPVNTEDITLQVNGNTMTASASLFSAEHVGSLWMLEHFMPAVTHKGEPGSTADVDALDAKHEKELKQVLFKILIASEKGEDVTPLLQEKEELIAAYQAERNGLVESASMQITVYESWRLETSGYWKGSFVVEKLDEATDTWIAIKTFSSSKDRNYSVVEAIPDSEATSVRIRNVDFEAITSEGNDYIGKVLLESTATSYQGYVRIIAVQDEKTAIIAVEKKVGSTVATKDWAEGAWSDVRGYPSCAAIYEQRLIFANTTHEPQTLWFSKSSDYTNFDVHISPQDDDAVTRTIASQQVNGIRHIIPLNDILTLTSTSEWKIGPSYNESTIKPTSFSAKPQGYRGCSQVVPVIVGSRILYVQDMGATIRDLGYSLESDGYVSGEINVLAKHLFYKKRIIDWTYQQEPDSIVWAVRNDGILLGLTYLKEQDVWAWHQHETDGQFESVCTIPGDDRNEVWLIVKRGERRFVERLTERLPTTRPEDQFFVDCGLSYSGRPTETLSGLEHLEGKEVAILADGNVLPRQTVQGGKITMPVSASKAHVGLGYMAEIETLKVDLPLKDGTIQGRYKTIPRAVIRVENTRGVWIGPTRDLMDEYKQRETENWDAPIELFTGDIEMIMPGGYDRDGKLIIQQRDPLPMTILSIIPEVVPGG